MSLASFLTFDDLYLFIVGTDKETIGFQEDMVAFMTGITSGCLGADYLKYFETACPIGDPLRGSIQSKIRHLPKATGDLEVSTYCDWPDAAVFPDNRAVAIFFGSCPDIQECEFLKKRAYAFCPVSGYTDKYPLNITGFKLLHYSPVLSPVLHPLFSSRA